MKWLKIYFLLLILINSFIFTGCAVKSNSDISCPTPADPIVVEKVIIKKEPLILPAAPLCNFSFIDINWKLFPSDNFLLVITQEDLKNISYNQTLLWNCIDLYKEYVKQINSLNKDADKQEEISDE